jgi:hypothetical protein
VFLDRTSAHCIALNPDPSAHAPEKDIKTLH